MSQEGTRLGVLILSLTDELLNYLQRVEQKAASPDFVPHPILKALMLAMKAAEDAKKDGNYVGLSGDADLTPDKQPHVSVAVVVKKEGEHMTVLEIKDAGSGKTISFEMARRIVISETLLERHEGQAVPNRAAENVISEALGLNVHILDDPDEVLQALAQARSAIRGGKVHGQSDALTEEILGITTMDQWGNASQAARSSVGGLWAEATKRNLVITALESTVPKWKVRETILRLLEQGFSK